MKKVLLGWLASAMLMAGAATLDGIAAKVNDEVVTVGDVMADITHNPEARAIFKSGNEVEIRKVYDDTVAALVNKRLILKQAGLKKLDVQEWIVDNRVREIIKESFGGDRNNLMTVLAEAHVPYEEWRGNIKEDMVVQAMRFQMVDKNLVATPGAMRKEYRDHPEKYSKDATVTMRVILLKPSSEPGVPSVSTRGAEVTERLAKGEDFAELAVKFSADSHAQEGGLWKDVKPEAEFREEIGKAVNKLRVGEYSELINLDGWGFIVKKEAEDSARVRTFAEAYDDISRTVRLEAGRKEYEAWLSRLRQNAYIKLYPMPKLN